MFTPHHRLSIQTPDQEEQQSLRKALRHKDSGGTHLPKNLSAAIKQFIVVVLLILQVLPIFSYTNFRFWSLSKRVPNTFLTTLGIPNAAKKRGVFMRIVRTSWNSTVYPLIAWNPVAVCEERKEWLMIHVWYLWTWRRNVMLIMMSGFQTSGSWHLAASHKYKDYGKIIRFGVSFVFFSKHITKPNLATNPAKPFDLLAELVVLCVR